VVVYATELGLPGARDDVREGAVAAAVTALLARLTPPRNARTGDGVTP
jgi:hypothetical protein